jgi:hypothetical protein
MSGLDEFDLGIGNIPFERLRAWRRKNGSLRPHTTNIGGRFSRK